jgi:hypothetical protein
MGHVVQVLLLTWFAIRCSFGHAHRSEMFSQVGAIKISDAVGKLKNRAP